MQIHKTINGTSVETLKINSNLRNFNFQLTFKNNIPSAQTIRSHLIFIEFDGNFIIEMSKFVSPQASLFKETQERKYRLLMNRTGLSSSFHGKDANIINKQKGIIVEMRLASREKRKNVLNNLVMQNG